MNVHIPFTFPLPRVASCQNLRLGFAFGNDQRLSPSNAARMDAPETPTPIALDNHRRAVTESPAEARVSRKALVITSKACFWASQCCHIGRVTRQVSRDNQDGNHHPDCRATRQANELQKLRSNCGAGSLEGTH